MSTRPIVALMMSRDEDDFIGTVLQRWHDWDIPVYALDASSDDTFEILSSFPNVTALHQEDYCAKPPPGTLHWLYQVLLDRKRRDYGEDTWVLLALADEIWYHDPRKIVAAMEAEGAGLLKMRMCNHLLHPEDKAKWDFEANCWKPEYARLPMAERVPHYCDHWFEYRGYLDKPGICYGHLSEDILPANLAAKEFSRTPLIQHHSVRNPIQAVTRANDRVERNFQPAYQPYYYGREPGEVFYDSFPKWSIVMKKFNGTYAEYEDGLRDLK